MNTVQKTHLRTLIVMPLARQMGGGEQMLLDLLLARTRHSIAFHVVFLEEGPMCKAARDAGAKVTVIKADRLRNLPSTIATIRRIAAAAKGWNADLLLGWMTKAQLYAGPAAVLVRRPCFWYQVGAPDWRSILDRAATALPADQVVVLSRYALERQTRLRPRRSVALVYPGVNLHQFDASRLPSKADCRSALGLPEKVPLIGLVGRLQRWKGAHTLVRAMPDVLRRHPDAHCVIVGGVHSLEPEYAEFLSREVVHLGLDKQVVMTGFQSNVAHWMQAMDVIVHASAGEPFGIVVLEGMALSKPLVACVPGGPEEVITNGLDGLLTPFEDTATLADAILRYLGDPAFTRNVGQAARMRALQFSTQAFADNLTQVLKTGYSMAANRGNA